MYKRVVTKVGDIFRARDGSFIQLVALDHNQLTSDVVVVYKSKNIDDFNNLHRMPISFYHHTTMSAGVKQSLWTKVGKGGVPDISSLQFKDHYDEVDAKILDDNLLRRLFRIKPRSYWLIWNPTSSRKKRINEEAGERLQIEDGGIVPPGELMKRISSS